MALGKQQAGPFVAGRKLLSPESPQQGLGIRRPVQALRTDPLGRGKIEGPFLVRVCVPGASP